MVQLYNYAHLNHLPFTLSRYNEPDYDIMRKFITGGLSNVFNRVNIAGETKINKLVYNARIKNIEVRQTDNVMTHAVGFDFNSLYPSSFSSNPHKFIPYTDNKMLMPGKITSSFFIENKQLKDKAMDLIDNGRQQTDYVFIASVKGYIPEDRINDCVNFPPIIRNLDIKTDKETLGNYMYNYLKSCELTTDKKERKLTNLLSTHGEYMAFSNYYLWFLQDNFDFVIEDINYFIKFDAHEGFNKFVNHFMNKRITFMNEGNKIYAFKPQPDRFLCFFYEGQKVVVTNAFRKKQQKLPKNEKEKALKIRDNYITRTKAGEYYD